MRILVASVDFLPKIGGVSLMTHHLANAIADEGHEVFVVSPFAAYASSDYPKRYTQLEDPNARPEYHTGDLWLRHERPNVCRRLSNMISNYHIDHTLALHFHYYGQALARLGSNTSFSVFFHGTEVNEVFHTNESAHNILLNLILNKFNLKSELRQIIRKASFCFSNSAFTRDLVTSVYNRPVTISGCGILYSEFEIVSSLNETQFKTQKENARAELNLSHERVYIGFIGRLAPEKNVQVLLQALTSLPNEYCLLILGEGPEHDKLQHLATNLDIFGRVRFLGKTDEATKKKVLNAIDIYCMIPKAQDSGKVEGFGISYLEAMASGIPVIGSPVGGIPEFVVDEETGFLCAPDKPKPLSDLILKLTTTDTELAKHVSENARKVVFNTHTWDKVSKRVLSRITQSNA